LKLPASPSVATKKNNLKTIGTGAEVFRQIIIPIENDNSVTFTSTDIAVS
jgi:hypothetical protein